MYRLMEDELSLGDDAYTMVDLFDDMRTGIFTDVRAGGELDVFQRNLQRGYVERLQFHMENETTGADVSQSDIRAYVRAELHSLKADLDRGATRAAHELTKRHYEDLSARIEETLDTD